VSQFDRLNRSFPWLVVSLLHACAGTEADNPVADGGNPAQITPCRSKSEYEPFALTELRGAQPTAERGWRLAATPAPEDRAQVFVSAGEGLTPLSEFPATLSCADWAIDAEELALQFVNFSSGCGIVWTGAARVVEPGVVALELKNSQCAVAACGSCSYDARGRVPLEAVMGQPTVTLRLSLDNCDGSPAVSEWIIDTSELVAGTRCQFTGYGFSPPKGTQYQLDLYESCDPNNPNLEFWGIDGVCAEAFTCTEEHCVPPCTTSEECPLNGAFECVDNACQLRK
jgi:hypothetical protein